MLEEIDEQCNGLGCNRTDFVIEAIQEKLQGKIEDQTTKQDTEEPKEKPKVVINLDDTPKAEPKELQNVRIVLEPEPKQIDNSNKPRIEMVLFNGRYIPKAEVYEI